MAEAVSRTRGPVERRGLRDLVHHDRIPPDAADVIPRHRPAGMVEVALHQHGRHPRREGPGVQQDLAAAAERAAHRQDGLAENLIAADHRHRVLPPAAGLYRE
jgi:hypothetical protein